MRARADAVLEREPASATLALDPTPVYRWLPLSREPIGRTRRLHAARGHGAREAGVDLPTQRFMRVAGYMICVSVCQRPEGLGVRSVTIASCVSVTQK